MSHINQLQLSTVEALKKIHSEHEDTVQYMKDFGTALEKIIAAMILEAAGGGENDKKL